MLFQPALKACTNPCKNRPRCDNAKKSKPLFFCILVEFIKYTIANLVSIQTSFDPPGGGGGGDSHMKQTGMLVGNFEFNP